MFLNKNVEKVNICFPAVTLRRIADEEKPLVLRLIWGGADRSHSFCLQENETGDIMVGC
jgi:hypothetical protein